MWDQCCCKYGQKSLTGEVFAHFVDWLMAGFLLKANLIWGSRFFTVNWISSLQFSKTYWDMLRSHACLKLKVPWSFASPCAAKSATLVSKVPGKSFMVLFELVLRRSQCHFARCRALKGNLHRPHTKTSELACTRDLCLWLRFFAMCFLCLFQLAAWCERDLRCTLMMPIKDLPDANCKKKASSQAEPRARGRWARIPANMICRCLLKDLRRLYNMSPSSELRKTWSCRLAHVSSIKYI